MNGLRVPEFRGRRLRRLRPAPPKRFQGNLLCAWSLLYSGEGDMILDTQNLELVRKASGEAA